MRRILISGVVLMSALLLVGHASADKESGTDEVLAWGDFIGIRIDTGGDSTEVEYDVTVTQGANVSVYYVPEKGWEEYNDETSPTFKYAPAYSVLETRSASKSFTETDGGVWYVIIENTDMSAVGENSTLTYEVIWEKTSLGDYTTGVAICIAIVIVVVIVVFFVRRVRRREEPLPPPSQPYDPQYQQSQYGDHPQRMPMAPSRCSTGGRPRSHANWSGASCSRAWRTPAQTGFSAASGSARIRSTAGAVLAT